MKEDKVPVTSGKKKACVRKETNAVSGMRVTIVHKNQNVSRHTFRALGVTRSKRVSIKGESNRGSILRQPCRYYLKGTCTRSLCGYWHRQFTKMKRVARLETKCLFPHYKFDEHPNNKPKKGYRSKKRRESDDKNAVAIAKIEPQLGCVSQDSKWKAVLEKPDAKKSWDRFEEYDSLSLRHIKHVSGKAKDHRWEK